MRYAARVPIDLTEFERGEPFTGDCRWRARRAAGPAGAPADCRRSSIASARSSCSKAGRRRARRRRCKRLGGGARSEPCRGPLRRRDRRRADDDGHWLAPLLGRLPRPATRPSSTAAGTAGCSRSESLGLVDDKRLGARVRRDQRIRSAAARPWHADRQAVLPRLADEQQAARIAERAGRSVAPPSAEAEPTARPRPTAIALSRALARDVRRRPTRAGRRGR